MSDSSLVPERQLVFSPGLAATIGLEESILLQQLHELLHYGSPRIQGGFAWLTVERDFLLRQLPFWQAIDLHRISRSLVDKGVLLVESPPIHSSEQFIFALNEPIVAATRPEPPPQPIEPSRRSAGLLPKHWSPSEDLLALLAMNHNIPRQFVIDQLEDFVFYWRESGETSHAWENKFRQHVLHHWRRHQQGQAEAFRTDISTDLDNNWRPSPDALEILDRSEISREFVEQTIPEFILFWRERSEAQERPAPRELNSKFIQHIRIQWAKYNSAREHSTEPKRISDQWYPAEDVFDVLRLSHIDEDFARSLIPEFIVYWKDSNQAHTSWNTKYLQHVKYHWAKHHQMENAGQANAGSQGSHQSGRTRDRSLEQDLTDTSWAK